MNKIEKLRPVAIIDNEARNIKDNFKENDNSLLCNKYGIPRGGIVTIMEKDIKGNIVSETKGNLIVYEGRENLIQMAFDKNRDSADPISRKDLFIYWFSVGTGGSKSDDVLSPEHPNAEDTSLSPNGGGEEIVIDAGNAAYANSGKKVPIELISTGSHPGNTLTFEQDMEQITATPPYLIAKINVTLDYGEANGNDISEAGLWLTNTRDSSDPNAVFKLWARCTFSTRRKIDSGSGSTQLSFLWYIYF